MKDYSYMGYVGLALSVLGLSLSAISATQQEDGYTKWFARAFKFAVAYVKCGCYCMWALLRHFVSAGKHPIEFQYTEYAGPYCTLLAVCSYAKDVPDLSGRYVVFDGKYVVTRTYFVDYRFHPVPPLSDTIK